ncbi:MAG: peptidylprolyl isomerase [Luteolibacter sp.]
MAAARAAAPAAPSDLKVTPLGVNSFKVEWKDNSTDEVGFELRVGLKSKNDPPRFLLLPFPNPTETGAKSYTITTNNLAGRDLDFQMTAYKGLPKFEVFSAPTPIVVATAFPTSTFGAPTLLKATAVDELQIKFRWKDNSTSEYGYLLEYKKGSGKWHSLVQMAPGKTSFSLTASGPFVPSTTYSFRVRAYKQSPALIYTKYSETVTVTTKSFQAPTKLVATPAGEGAFSFKWKDNSSLDAGVEIQRKTGAGEFERYLKAAGVNLTRTDPLGNFLLDTDYQFRVRVYRLKGTKEVFSGYSNVFSARSAPMLSPTNFAGTVPNNTSVTLTWKGASAVANGYELQYREVGTTNFYTKQIYSRQESYTLTGFEPNKNYEFRIRNFSFFQTAKSAYSPLIQLHTKDSVVSNLNPLIFAGTQFLYQIQCSHVSSTLTNLAVTGLPAGLVFNPAYGTITGTLTAPGTSFSVVVTATFADGSKDVRTVTLKLSGKSPIVVQNFATVSVPVSTPATVSVIGKFSDPDTLSAARVTTTAGTFDIILFPEATPNTLNNFLDYVDANAFDNSFFHRTFNNSIVQGGCYKHTTADGFSRIGTFAPVVNEPGLSNVRGTIAMAKQSGNPNSATSQWFVNVMDNSDTSPLFLDSQNGGFTVFGRVPASGMQVLDAINTLPKGNYNDPTGAGIDPLEDVPINAATAPATLNPNELVKITTVGAAPILSYQVVSQDTAVATAAIISSDILITGVATGKTTVQVTATDLDGNSVSQNIAVTVP